jgi:hypothetical protein
MLQSFAEMPTFILITGFFFSELLFFWACSFVDDTFNTANGSSFFAHINISIFVIAGLLGFVQLCSYLDSVRQLTIH